MASSDLPAMGGMQPVQNPSRGTAHALSCTNCRQRKVKCDKFHPCQHCQRSNLTCVFPERARHPKKKRDGPKATNDELLNRLRRMEELIGKIDAGKEGAGLKSTPSPGRGSISESQSQSPQPSRSSSITYEGLDQPEDGLNKYIGNTFLRSLTTEVEGLKQSMEEVSDEEEYTPKSSSDAPTPQSATVFGSTLSAPKDLRLLHPSPTHISQLCALFIDNVDPMFKVLHIPSLRSMVSDAISNVDAIPSGTYVEALLFAIYYAAITTLTREECLQLFNDGKDSLLAKYRAGTERALSNADFLCSCDLGKLQALAIFLLAVRANDDSMYSWTMMGVAVRLAHSLGLHREGSHTGISPFTQELRRRLWWQIVVLDVRASEDISADPMILELSFNTKKPMNINDSDMDPTSNQPIIERNGYTEMTKVSLSHEVSPLAWRLGYIPPMRDNEEPPGRSLDEKIRMLGEWEEHLQTNIFPHCDPSVPTAWVTTVIAQLITRRLRLAIYHPVQHSSRPTERPQVSREILLKTAIECMEFSHLLDTDPIAARWRWFFKTYVQWHALAATLAELCVQTKGPLVDRAWRIIDVVFDDWANRIADSPSGMLWRPIKKLKSKAQGVRNEARISSLNLNAQTQQQVPLPYFGTSDSNILQSPINNLGPLQSATFPDYRQNVQRNIYQTGSRDSFGGTSVLDTDTSGMTTDEMTGTMNWAEWDQFMQDFQMEDQMTQPSDVPATFHDPAPLKFW